MGTREYTKNDAQHVKRKARLEPSCFQAPEVKCIVLGSRHIVHEPAEYLLKVCGTVKESIEVRRPMLSKNML